VVRGFYCLLSFGILNCQLVFGGGGGCRVMEVNEPKTISKTIAIQKQKSSVDKAFKKRFAKKRVSKKRIKKRVIKKKIQNIDFSKLKDVQTLGVLSTSKPFELKQ
jgi:hypothetical protein